MTTPTPDDYPPWLWTLIGFAILILSALIAGLIYWILAWVFAPLFTTPLGACLTLACT